MKSCGFTLVELLITLTLASIIAVFGYGHWVEFVQKAQMQTQVNQILSALNFARNQAILTGEIITFCKSNDGLGCSGDWSDGQVLLQAQKPIRVFNKIPGDAALHYQGFASNDSILFQPLGFSHNQNGTFVYCSKNNKYSREIIISRAGRARVAKTTQC